jgi:hypothetical protein
MAYYFILFCCGSGSAWIRFDLASMDTDPHWSRFVDLDPVSKFSLENGQLFDCSVVEPDPQRVI